jgi:hypothetical protein
MLSLLSDENFNGDIVRGLFLRQSNLDKTYAKIAKKLKLLNRQDAKNAKDS